MNLNVLAVVVALVSLGTLAHADDGGSSADSGQPPLPGWGGEVQVPLFTMVPDPRQLALYLADHAADEEPCIPPERIDFYPPPEWGGGTGVVDVDPAADEIHYHAHSYIDVADPGQWTCGTVHGYLQASVEFFHRPPPYTGAPIRLAMQEASTHYCNDEKALGPGTEPEDQDVCETYFAAEGGDCALLCGARADVHGYMTLSEHPVDFWDTDQFRSAKGFQWIPPGGKPDEAIDLGPETEESWSCEMFTFQYSPICWPGQGPM